MPGPLELAGDYVETADLAARHIDRTVVADARTHDDCISDDGGRRSFLVVFKIARGDAQTGAQVHDPVVPESGARPTGAGIDSDQARIDGGDEDAAFSRSGLPGGNTTIGEVAVSFVPFRLAIV